MNAEQLPIALIAFMAFVALMPAWMHFSGEYTASMPAAASWIARFTMPAAALLFVGSWLGGDIA